MSGATPPLKSVPAFFTTYSVHVHFEILPSCPNMCICISVCVCVCVCVLVCVCVSPSLLILPTCTHIYILLVNTIFVTYPHLYILLTFTHIYILLICGLLYILLIRSGIVTCYLQAAIFIYH